MSKTAIHSDSAPAAVGPYSHAAAVGGFVFTSGQLGLSPRDGSLAQGVAAQARQAILNLQAVLEAAGLSLADVVKTTVFLADMNDFAEANGVYAEFFSEPYPARSCVEAARLPKDALFEIEAVAAGK